MTQPKSIIDVCTYNTYYGYAWPEAIHLLVNLLLFIYFGEIFVNNEFNSS